jgi:hypothetical protein
LRVRFALPAARKLIQDLSSVRTAASGWKLSLCRLMKRLLRLQRLFRLKRKRLRLQLHLILFARRVEPRSSPKRAFVQIADSLRPPDLPTLPRQRRKSCQRPQPLKRRSQSLSNPSLHLRRVQKREEIQSRLSWSWLHLRLPKSKLRQPQRPQCLRSKIDPQ